MKKSRQERLRLTNAISVRLSIEDTKLLDEVAKACAPIPKLTLLRHAMRMGLILLARDPTKVLEKKEPR